MMNRFENWFISRLIKKEVVQGPRHKQNIERIYGMVREACEKEFTEDNHQTLEEKGIVKSKVQDVVVTVKSVKSNESLEEDKMFSLEPAGF